MSHQPDWLKSILERFKSVDDQLAKISTGELTELRTKLATAEESVKTLNGTISDLNGKISTLETAATSHAEAIKAKDGEIAKLTKDLETEKSRAQEVLAGQNLDPANLPAGSTETAGVKSVDQQVAALREKLAKTTDSKEKYTLSQEIKALTSKRNQN